MEYKHLEFRRKFWKLFGAEISVLDGTNANMVGFIKMKAWKLREQIHVYTDSTQQQEVITIRARNIIDFGATYDVTDPSGQALFSLRRQGIKSSFIRDHWDIMDAAGAIIGRIEERNAILALLRRWLGGIADLVFMIVPQHYDISSVGQNGAQQPIASITHRKNPFIVKMSLDASNAPAGTDARFFFAIGALLSVIDAAKS